MKRTIAIQNACELRVELSQLIIRRDKIVVGKVPLEDLGVLILEDRGIVMSRAVLSEALNHNAAVIVCDNAFHPNGLLLNLNANRLQRKMFEAQLMAGEPLKKNLWKSVVTRKLSNQAKALDIEGKPSNYVTELSKKVKSGDSSNCEATAAAYYWRHIFSVPLQRERDAPPPNAFLNYGYAVLRAMTARALVASGLLPTWGIHHRNQYNAYCLADDLMEPFRPLVDLRVAQILHDGNFAELNPEVKKIFWGMATWDVMNAGQRQTLEHALSMAATSLQKSFIIKRPQLELADVVAPL